MIITLLLLFFVFITMISIYFFKVAFVKGKMFNITTTTFNKKNKLSKFLDEMKENLDFIQNLPYELQYIRSYDGLRLAGKLYKNNNSDKIIILFHGYRSIAENDFSIYFKWYYDLGFNILLIDQRAHGKSDGKYITLGIKEKKDCVSWCQYVIEHIDGINEIVLGGISMGATTILLASGLDLPNEVKGIIADCGFTSPKNIIIKVANYDYGINAKVLLPLINLICKIKDNFSIYKDDVRHAMQNNKIPILFIHGLSDNYVPSRMSKENYEACNSRKELVMIDCVNHGLSCVQDKEKVHNSIKKFLKSLV